MKSPRFEIKRLCKDCVHWSTKEKSCLHPKANPDPNKMTFFGIWGACHCLDKKYFEQIESKCS